MIPRHHFRLDPTWNCRKSLSHQALTSKSQTWLHSGTLVTAIQVMETDLNFHMKGFWTILSPLTCLPWKTLLGAKAPDSSAPRISWAPGSFQHIKVEAFSLLCFWFASSASITCALRLMWTSCFYLVSLLSWEKPLFCTNERLLWCTVCVGGLINSPTDVNSFADDAVRHAPLN